MEVFLYVLFFGTYLYFNYRKYGFNGSSFLIFVYLLSSSAGLGLLVFYNTYDVERISIAAILYHIFCLFLFISPVIYFFNNYPIDAIKKINDRGFKYFAYSAVLFSLLSLAVNIPKLFIVFSNPDLRMARILANQGLLYEESSKGLLEYLGTFGHMFSFITLFIFFNLILFKPEKKLLILIIGICCLTDVIKGFTIMGRGGVIRFLLFAGFLFFTYKNYLSDKIVRKIKKASVILFSPFILVFLFISISRFSDRENSVTYFFVDYMGQSFINFSYNFYNFMDNTFGGRLNFQSFFSQENQLTNKNVNDLVLSVDYLNTFSTFVGSFYKDFGFIRTLFLGLTLNILLFMSSRYSKNNYTLSKIVINLLLVQVYLTGVFYYMYSGTMAFNSFLLIIFITLVIQLFFSKNKRFVL